MTTESLLIIDYTDENGEKRMQKVRFPVDVTYEDFTGRLASRLGQSLAELDITYTDPVEKCDFDLSPDEDLITIIQERYRVQVKVKKGTFAKPKDSNESAVTPAVAIDNVTNSWQARVKTNWMCKKSGAQHSFFLSYRVDTEKSFSQTLAHALDAGVRSSLTIHAFLDVHCLTSGAEWIDSFIIGLWNSTVFVPVCSDAAMRKMKAAHETPDNMLLEWEIALDIRDKNLHDISIFPVLVGEYLTVAIPDPVAGTRDRRVLATFSSFSGFPDAYHSHPLSPRTRKIKDTISEILKYQGVRADPDIIDPTANDLLRMWNELKQSAAAPAADVAAKKAFSVTSNAKGTKRPDKGYLVGWHCADAGASHTVMKNFDKANKYFDNDLDGIPRVVLDVKTEKIYLSDFLPQYDFCREEVEGRLFATLNNENLKCDKSAFVVIVQEAKTKRIRYEKFDKFSDAEHYYNTTAGDAPVLVDKNGDIWMCQMEAGEIGRIHVLRHLEGWLGRKVQLSSPAVQPKYIFSCHHGSARSTVFSDFEKARAKFNEIGDGFARVLSDTAGRVYLSYFFPEYDNVRTEVMDCHYRKIKEEIYSSKTFAVVYHHPVKGLQSDLFPDYKAASVHFDTLNLAKLLRDGNGNIYDCEFKPYASKYRDQVLKHAAGLKI